MKRHAVAVLAVAALSAGALAACDNPKPRKVPADPMALPPPPAAPAAAPGAGMSPDLPRRSELPGFYLDRVGQAPDPVSKQPAATPGDQPIVISGFGFDPAKVPAKGVDVAIDGKAYGATYGGARPDVANYFKVPALAATGYSLTLPAGTLADGPHNVTVRVIAADGTAYFESPSVPFTVD